MKQRAGDAPQIFRPHWALSAACVVAALLWITALGALLVLGGTRHAIFSAAAFVAFFAATNAYLLRAAIIVDPTGLTYRGILRSRRYRFEQVRGLQVIPGPVTVYSVAAPDGFIRFTSFFRRHQRLLEVLAERTRLVPEPV